MRQRRHRQYGLPNANQILIGMAICTLLFFSLLRHHWLQFAVADEALDVSAGLRSVHVKNNRADAAYSVSWATFCADGMANGAYTLDVTSNSHNSTTIVSYWDGQVLCEKHVAGTRVPRSMMALLATALAMALSSVLLSLYLQLGSPSRAVVFWLGTLPGLTLLVTAVLCTTALALWQRFFGRFDNGDCFSITVAATVIAYGVAISMVVRWRWPGICAVPSEQQALGARSYHDQLPLRRRGRRRGSTAAQGAAGASTATAEPQLAAIAVPLNR